MTSDKIIVPPFVGEFGWFVIRTIREVDKHPAKHKVVCCRPGQEIFFPSADAFFYDYDAAFKEKGRNAKVPTLGLGRVWHVQAANAIANQCRYSNPDYADHEIFNTTKGNCYKHSKDIYHFPKLTPKLEYDPVDVVFSTRNRREFKGKNRSADFYTSTLKLLMENGYTTGVVGIKKQSINLPYVDSRSWDYPYEEEATVAMMQNAKLVVTTNTGISHLAVMLRCPLFVIENAPGMMCWMEMQRDPNIYFERMLERGKRKEKLFECHGRKHILGYLDKLKS